MSPKTHFYVQVSAEETLGVAEIWPDGDAPANPTAVDVIEQIRRTTDEHHFATDWGFDVRTEVDGLPVWI